MGATNRNEQGVLMYNQCFYLSLARAYLSGMNVCVCVCEYECVCVCVCDCVRVCVCDCVRVWCVRVCFTSRSLEPTFLVYTRVCVCVIACV